MGPEKMPPSISPYRDPAQIDIDIHDVIDSLFAVAKPSPGESFSQIVFKYRSKLSENPTGIAVVDFDEDKLTIRISGASRWVIFDVPGTYYLKFNRLRNKLRNEERKLALERVYNILNL